MLKSPVPHFYPKMHLTCTNLRNPSRLKEPSLKARLELFATNITVLEMRWQHVPNLRCHDARSEYVAQSCHRCQQNEAENEREQRRSQRRSMNRCRGSTLVIGHGCSVAVICHQRNFERNACSLQCVCCMFVQLIN